jgi:hypothetical protein
MLSLSTSLVAQRRAYQVTDRQVQTVVERIERSTNAFRVEVDRNLDRSPIDGTDREDSINTRIANFETATDRLRDNFLARRSTGTDVENVLSSAVTVNTFVTNNRLSRLAETQWTSIRADLNTLAGYYRVAANWDAMTTTPGNMGGYTATDVQLRTLLNRLSVRARSFRYGYVRYQRFGGRGQTPDISTEITELENGIRELRLDYRNSRSTDVEEVLTPSASINSFVTSNRVSTDLSNRWNLLRTDLSTLASYYRLAWNWDVNQLPIGDTSFGSFDSRLTGTYRLNTSLSDNMTTVLDRAVITASTNTTQRDRVRRNLERRLVSPAMLAIDKRGREVILVSGNAPQVTLVADGTSRSETSPNGRTVRTSVTATARDLTINYEGDRMNDYFITFAPLANGLRVTRRVYLENQNETVSITSVYDKISQTADLNMTADYPSNNSGNTTVGGFIVPNNTGIVATLDTALSTRTARDGDRFSMTVTSPSQYQGAVIEGIVNGEKSGVVSGRANLSLSFDTIRLRNGQTYRFAGIVDQVREPDGDVVSVNNEGAIRDSSQTTKTVTRAGIGAALGALIGAIAGGGSGAAIGAGVGAGAGAGTVILQGRDNLELGSGSQFTITATAPATTSNR